MKLIFAQGNPEPEYALSRHNVGFLVLNTIATIHSAKWAAKTKFKALIAEVMIDGEKVILAKPTTFYNETGISARKLIDFYKVNPETDFLVLHDDLALPFGTVRIRPQGGDAGNNGIKSINNHIEHDYTRIKIGISNDEERFDDAAFVLAKFNNQELTQLIKTIIPHSVKLVDQFIDNSLQHTSYKNLE
ncbi:aminoacyl-tRNA hydrolase [Candidatus Saccharibacteria bacterium]|nr:aminoacyl-tRNA hydrolase [Candidatus Saccharibacteria bacterium]